jgi:hypothetical protein
MNFRRKGTPTPAGAGGGLSSSSLDLPRENVLLSHHKAGLRFRCVFGESSRSAAEFRGLVERDQRLLYRVNVHDRAAVELAQCRGILDRSRV